MRARGRGEMKGIWRIAEDWERSLPLIRHDPEKVCVSVQVLRQDSWKQTEVFNYSICRSGCVAKGGKEREKLYVFSFFLSAIAVLHKSLMVYH